MEMRKIVTAGGIEVSVDPAVAAAFRAGLAQTGFTPVRPHEERSEFEGRLERGVRYGGRSLVVRCGRGRRGATPL